MNVALLSYSFLSEPPHLGKDEVMAAVQQIYGSWANQGVGEGLKEPGANIASFSLWHNVEAT